MENAAGLKAALVDFDQTLVDLPVDWDRLRADIAVLFAAYGINSTMRPLLSSLRKAFAELEERGLTPGQRGSLRRKVNMLLNSAERDAAARAKAMPGARSLVSALRANGMLVIIQSSNCVRAIELALERTGLPAPDAIVGRQSARRVKPHPEGVRRALRRCGLKGSDCVVIGDGDFDVELGRTLGAVTVRLGEGRERADHTIASLSELPKALLGRRAAA